MELLLARRAKIVVSIRDPRDCIVSLLERFGSTFELALERVGISCESIQRVAGFALPVYRYEDVFYEKTSTLRFLHQHLNSLHCPDFYTLGEYFSQESIRTFIDDFDALPSERRVANGADEFDVITQWHRNHFGDGLVGKWRSRLSGLQHDEMSRVLRVALRNLGYESEMAGIRSGLDCDSMPSLACKTA